MAIRSLVLVSLFTLCSVAAGQMAPGVKAGEIIRLSEHTTHLGFERTPDFDYCMTENHGDKTKTYAVFMISGSTYDQLVALDGVTLSAEEQEKQAAARKDEAERRGIETPGQRSQRVEKYEKEQRRNQALLEQMPKAFDFMLMGNVLKDGREAFVLNATPRRGYEPIDRQTRILTGMRGTLWIDRSAYGWVRAEAVVVHPVMIEGFLARVEKGTRFTLEERPFGDGIWLPTLFSVYAKARILFLFPKTSREEYTFYHYVPKGTLKPEDCLHKATPSSANADQNQRPKR